MVINAIIVLAGLVAFSFLLSKFLLWLFEWNLKKEIEDMEKSNGLDKRN